MDGVRVNVMLPACVPSYVNRVQSSPYGAKHVQTYTIDNIYADILMILDY